MNVIKRFIVEDEGAEIAEYALLVVILALGLLTAAPGLTSSLTHAFQNTSSKVDTNAGTLGALPNN
jgi:Flp pilus assembly pilin Flp